MEWGLDPALGLLVALFSSFPFPGPSFSHLESSRAGLRPSQGPCAWTSHSSRLSCRLWPTPFRREKAWRFLDARFPSWDCNTCTSVASRQRCLDPVPCDHGEELSQGPDGVCAKVRGSSCTRRAGLPLCLEHCAEKQTQLCLFQKLHILIICSLGVMPPR